MGCKKLHTAIVLELNKNTLVKTLTSNKSKKSVRRDYMFGFNGQEKDNEIKGAGNSLDFGARVYDSRLGRWLSLDPLMSKYPSLSPYVYCNNNPILYLDPDGKRFFIATGMSENDTKLALSDVQGLIGNANYNNLIVHNTQTGEIKFDINQVPLNERNAGMVLLSKVTLTPKKIVYEVATAMNGYDRDNCTPTSAPLSKSNNDKVNTKVASNLSTTERGSADEQEYLSNKGASQQRYDSYDALPRDNFDGQITLSPYTGSYYDDFLQHPEDQAKGNNKYTYLRSETRSSLLFHELSENYYRTVENDCFGEAHNKAKKDERSLPANHPSKGVNPGSSTVIPDAKKRSP
jgi:RHS repeat-associated protein